jgi:coenzyme F420 biosynthesis associated uncharacterized protein
MSGAVDWSVAESVAIRFAGREPFSQSYYYDSLEPDFVAMTAQAQELVESHTGWQSQAGEARAKVADRAHWIRANIASFQRMLRPLISKLEEQPMAGVFAPVAGRIAGAEMGAVLGWMSTRVLGQYDMLVLEEEEPEEQDLVYYVGPNILALEKRFAFPPSEFRLWVALHEVTHRTQFTGIPWLRPYFLSLVHDMIGHVDADPAVMFKAVGRVAESLRRGDNPLKDGGVVTLLASDEQRATMDRIGGLMSLLEGHGDITMDRAGGDRIPSAERFGRVLRQRRQNAAFHVKILQRLIGLEAKLNQYEQGEEFIESVEKVGGQQLVDVAFESAVTLPSLAEIRDPDSWIQRVRPLALAAGQ